LGGEPLTVNACERGASCVVAMTMTEGAVSTALVRAERALDRIERALASRPQNTGKDEELRTKVREVVAELDELIRAAG